MLLIITSVYKYINSMSRRYTVTLVKKTKFAYMCTSIQIVYMAALSGVTPF